MSILGTTDFFTQPLGGTRFVRSVAPVSVSFGGNGDAISQEGRETFTLVVNIIGSIPNGFFLRDRLMVFIVDSTRK